MDDEEARAATAADNDRRFVWRIVATLAAILFGGELAVMAVFNALPPVDPVFESLADATILALLTIPVVLLAVVRPLQRRIAGQVAVLHEMLRDREWMVRVFDSVDECIAVTTPDGVLEHVNPSFTRLMGYAAEEVVGRRNSLLKSGEHDQAFYAEMWNRLRTMGTWQGRIVDRTKSGQRLELFLTISPLRDARGGISGYVAIHRDLGPLLEHERQLRVALDEQTLMLDELARAKEQAVNASAGKSRFLSTMSHEIRTPLAGVLGTLDLLESGQLEPEQKEYVELAQRSSRALMAVLNDVLDFSKIEAQGVTLEPAPFDVLRAVRDVRELFLAQAQTKGLRLEVQGGEGACWVKADQGRLKQVLSNLVGNAVKFTRAGQVRMLVQATPTAGLVDLRLAVEDTGIGIPADRVGALFQPFTQAETSTARRFGGTGLGLAISRRIADAMGGTLTVTSQEGQGTAFTFALRVEGAEPVTSSLSGVQLAPTDALAMKGLRVLMAEDNPVNQLVVSRMLQRLQCVVSVVENGKVALERLRTHTFDVVLMDQQMPEMDGLTATRAIRASGTAWAQVPIVALTANAFGEDREQCLAAGMTAFLSKPVSEPKLVRTVLAVTGRRVAPPA